VSTGEKSDRLLDGSAPDIVPPAEYFIALQPGLILHHPINERMRLSLDGMASIERFYGEGGGVLMGMSGGAEFMHRFGPRWRWRAAAGGEYFNDTSDEQLNRWRLGGELGLGLVDAHGYLEVTAGLQTRQYPDMHTIDWTGRELQFGDDGAWIGATAAFRPLSWIELTGVVNRQEARTRDPLFDNHGYLASGSFRCHALNPLRIQATASVLDRSFQAWSDTYRQLGAALIYGLAGSLDVSLRYTQAEYESSFESAPRMWRVSLALTWWAGGGDLLMPLDGPSPLQVRPPAAGERQQFRLLAPQARDVALVGDFNGWNPATNPMVPVGGGWWQVWVALPSGAHQYAYWVDGAARTPPESEITVEDGFGGRNGVVHVEPSSL